jgi:prepilin-type N-terminal cleavage/methylation domain-containing protein
MNAHRKRGFTLIELLVVIAIIAILAAILFPVFAQAKVAAKKASAISQAKQLSLAVLMYADGSDDLLNPRRRLGFGPGKGGDPSDALTWEYFVFPYVKSIEMFGSPEDQGTKFVSPIGKYRRSWQVVPNSFPGWQENLNSTRPLKTSKSVTWFPEPSRTLSIIQASLIEGPKAKTDPANYWKTSDWALGTEIETLRKFPQDAACPFKNESWFLSGNGVRNYYNNGAVYGFIDGHAAYKAVTYHAKQNSACATTRFEGYEQKAWPSDDQAANFPEWTNGLTCVSIGDKWEDSKTCKVPGE